MTDIDIAAADPANQAPLGHNLGEPIDDLFDELRARTDEITKTGNRWLTERPEIADEDQAAAATVFVKQVNAHKKTIEIARKGRNEPHRDAIKANDTRFHALVRPLDIAAQAVKQALGGYLAKKDAIAAEERRRAEAEALAKIEAAEAAKREAAKAEGDVIGNTVRAEEAEKAAEDATRAAAKAAEPVAVRSDTGQTASVTKRTTFEIIDHRKVDLEALRLHFTPDVIDRAVRSFIKHGGRELAGVRIFETTTAVVR